jgi:uncharacterized protein (DUF1015 family)
MAEVRPFRALHYNLAAIPSLDAVTAPPYDVIDAEQRAELVARSSFNVVEIDLPQAPAEFDPYEHATSTLESWTLEGILAADRKPALWALTQDYAAPDGTTQTRHGILAAVRLEEYGPGRIRPHERTQPGPKEDRLNLMRATHHATSAIFALSEGDAWPHVEPALDERPWGEVTDSDGTVHRIWRVADPAVHEAVAAELADSELLIADGHHRYETARAYAAGIEGEGAHSYTLICLTSLADPGLTVFPTHRLLTELSDSATQEALGAGLKRLFEVEEVTTDRLDPTGEDGVGVFGYIDAHLRRPFRLRLRDTAELDAALAGRPEAYRRIDAVILEQLVLKGILRMTADDIAAKRGLRYVKSATEVLGALDSGDADAAFLLRPTPVEQVRDVAAAGETMPPKSTYFFPKLLSGLVFYPLS